MKNLIALSIAVLAGTTASAAQDNCPSIKAEIVQYHPDGSFSDKLPMTTTLDYGDWFTVVLAGTYPGYICMETINPLSERSLIGRGFYSGKSTIELPCGLDTYCTVPREHAFYLEDDGDSSKATEKEILLINYFPCRTNNAKTDRATQVFDTYGTLPVCKDLVVDCTKDVPPQQSYESVRVRKFVRKSCEKVKDDGKLMLYETFNLQARRN